MIFRKLDDNDYSLFFNFLEIQKKLNLEKNRPWFIENVEFNHEKRQVFGAFENKNLIAVMSCYIWNSMPFSTFDTFVISKNLGLKKSKECVTNLKILALQWAEENNRTVHLYVGPYKESKLMICRKGLWTNALKQAGYIYTEIGYIPATKKVDHKLLNIMIGDRTYPTDMIIFMIVKDLKNVPDNWNDIINLT